MRLEVEEVQALKKILKSYSAQSKIFLHGSRIDDEAKGGDIDLFYIVPDSELNELISKKHYIVSELTLALAEQKVDLTCISFSNSKSHIFFNNSQKKEL
jgi:predicted nucleotidyltransferase